MMMMMTSSERIGDYLCLTHADFSSKLSLSSLLSLTSHSLFVQRHFIFILLPPCSFFIMHIIPKTAIITALEMSIIISITTTISDNTDNESNNSNWY